MILSLFFLASCSGKKSAFGAEISKRPEPKVIDEEQLDQLAASDEQDYYLLFCNEKDTVMGCPIILEKLAECTLNEPASLYVFCMEPLFNFTRIRIPIRIRKKLEEGIEISTAFFAKHRLRSVPSLRHRVKNKIVDSFTILNTDNTLDDLPEWIKAQ